MFETNKNVLKRGNVVKTKILKSKNRGIKKFTNNHIFILSMMMFPLFFASCGSKKEEKEEDTKFIVTSPLKKDTLITKEYVCQVHAIQHIEIRTLEKGYIEKIFVDEGQSIKKGTLIFKIMPLIYNAELQKAQAEADFVEIEYQNTKQLSDKNVVSANELALAKAKWDKAKAELSLAQTHLQFTEIRAPFDGIMDHFRVRLGSLVNEGDLLTTLSDNSKMWVYFNVPEAEYLNYKEHAKSDEFIKVNLQMANNQIFDYPGIVQTIEADFNNETGNIAFRATFPNPNGLLRHGETGNIEMAVPLKHAIIIPQKATFEILEKKYVFVVGKDNIVKIRPITIKAELPDLYIISKGLTENDKIILEGIRKTKDNDKIKYEYQDPKKVLASLKVYVE